ncbi:MAG: Lipoyl synthase [Chlamydiia bacterium]|nr:Lipoyl synthase [Chlamydiia bacterium]
MDQENHPLNIIKEREPLPSWLHRKLPSKKEYSVTDNLINQKMLATVCEEAKCPNRFECYSKKTATFLLLGKICTRACGFCEIGYSKTPPPLDPLEGKKVAESVTTLGLKHVVLTQVARDDLEDGGASSIVNTIKEIRKAQPCCTIEVLISDLQGNMDAIDLILGEKPEIFNYNVETVRRLSPKVRHKATYERTIEILTRAKRKLPESFIKSGLMLGLGEEDYEIEETLQDLHSIGIDIVTMGQYLKPSKRKLSVKEYVHPDKFASWKVKGEELGIPFIYSGPYVRSSYNAGAVFDKLRSLGDSESPLGS